MVAMVMMEAVMMVAEVVAMRTQERVDFSLVFATPAA